MTTYTLRTPASPDRALEVWSLAELAELVQCAIAAGDPIERVGAEDAAGVRPLTTRELGCLLEELCRGG